MQLLPLLTQSACGRHAQRLEEEIAASNFRKKKGEREKLPESILWSQSLRAYLFFLLCLRWSSGRMVVESVKLCSSSTKPH